MADVKKVPVAREDAQVNRLAKREELDEETKRMAEKRAAEIILVLGNKGLLSTEAHIRRTQVAFLKKAYIEAWARMGEYDGPKDKVEKFLQFQINVLLKIIDKPTYNVYTTFGGGRKAPTKYRKAIEQLKYGMNIILQQALMDYNANAGIELEINPVKGFSAHWTLDYLANKNGKFVNSDAVGRWEIELPGIDHRISLEAILNYKMSHNESEYYDSGTEETSKIEIGERNILGKVCYEIEIKKVKIKVGYVVYRAVRDYTNPDDETDTKSLKQKGQAGLIEIAFLKCKLYGSIWKDRAKFEGGSTTFKNTSWIWGYKAGFIMPIMPYMDLILEGGRFPVADVYANINPETDSFKEKYEKRALAALRIHSGSVEGLTLKELEENIKWRVDYKEKENLFNVAKECLRGTREIRWGTKLFWANFHFKINRAQREELLTWIGQLYENKLTSRKDRIQCLAILKQYENSEELELRRIYHTYVTYGNYKRQR